MKFITNYDTEITADDIMDAIETFMQDSNATREYHGLEPIFLEGYKVCGDSASLITDWGAITIRKED